MLIGNTSPVYCGKYINVVLIYVIVPMVSIRKSMLKNMRRVLLAIARCKIMAAGIIPKWGFNRIKGENINMVTAVRKIGVLFFSS